MVHLQAITEAMQQRLEFLERQYGGTGGSNGGSNGSAKQQQPSHAKLMGLF